MGEAESKPAPKAFSHLGGTALSLKASGGIRWRGKGPGPPSSGFTTSRGCSPRWSQESRKRGAQADSGGWAGPPPSLRGPCSVQPSPHPKQKDRSGTERPQGPRQPRVGWKGTAELAPAGGNPRSQQRERERERPACFPTPFLLARILFFLLSHRGWRGAPAGPRGPRRPRHLPPHPAGARAAEAASQASALGGRRPPPPRALTQRPSRPPF